MRFYLACITAFALMTLALHSCCAEEFMRVTQASTHQTGKGGEAERIELHHRKTHKKHHLRHALSAALPRPRPHLLSLPERFDDEAFRTPQQIIDTEFQAIGWETDARVSNR